MPSRTKTHIRDRTCAHIQHQSHTNTHTSERCVEFQLPDGGDCLYELASNCVADLCKNSLWSQIHRGERDGENERNREKDRTKGVEEEGLEHPLCKNRVGERGSPASTSTTPPSVLSAFFFWFPSISLLSF